MHIKSDLPFDYTYLVSQLKDYARPRDKITQLIRKGDIIRIKKGLYITPENRNPYLKEILAGMIYGPSYISLEYALAYYQMIPEQVKIVTSITSQKPKTYQTPAGGFRYQHIRQELFALGLDFVSHEESGFWIATREKALCDLVYLKSRNLTPDRMGEFLQDDMRIDPSELSKLNIGKISDWQKAYNQPGIAALASYLKGGVR
jgi:hypothetical protein